jgi:hypothetical protein
MIYLIPYNVTYGQNTLIVKAIEYSEKDFA